MQITKFILFVSIFPVFITGCAGLMEVQSISDAQDIRIDGIADDWGTGIHFLKEDNIGFGFRNNENELFISIVTSDRNKIMKILSAGLIVWLESDKDIIGIRYPMRIPPEEMREARMDIIPGQDIAPGQERDAGPMIRKFISLAGDIQVINEDELPLYTDKANTGKEFRASMGYNDSRFVYELKIPFDSKAAQRVFSKEIKTVDILFATGEFERGEMPGREPGMRRGGNMPGGRQRPGGVGMRPGGPGMDFEPMKYTFRVRL